MEVGYEDYGKMVRPYRRNIRFGNGLKTDRSFNTSTTSASTKFFAECPVACHAEFHFIQKIHF